MTYLLLMLVALLIELAVGWPRWLYSWIKHPVVWMGSLIALLDKYLNNAGKTYRYRQITGAITTFTVVAVSAGIAWIISFCLSDNWLGFLIQALLASSLLASRSLYEHVNAVARPLSDANYAQAREALGHIVGRDTSSLEESGMASAAIESLAENASDGVFAPLFWGLLLGLPGIAAYKAINTLDSMIAHRSEKYLAFGLVSAKLDDAANVIPSRLSALLIAIVGGSMHRLAEISRDARQHQSPNAGWPESAMAYAMDVQLSGPRSYNNTDYHEPWINHGSAPPKANDVRVGLNIYLRSLVLTVVLLATVLLGNAILSTPM